MEIYPGFAASEVLYRNGGVAGVATNDMGVAKSGVRKETFQRGMELRAKVTLFAEGCRGSLSEVLIWYGWVLCFCILLLQRKSAKIGRGHCSHVRHLKSTNL